MELREISKDKKAMSIGDLYPIIIIIATVAILLGILMMVLTAWTGVTSDRENGVIMNETISDAELIAGLDTVRVDGLSACRANTFSLTNITNATVDAGASDDAVGAGNYTFTVDGVFTNLTSEYALDGFNISYTYLYGGADCSAMEDIVGDFTDFVPWIGIILLVIAASIVLGIVINSFRNRRV